MIENAVIRRGNQRLATENLVKLNFGNLSAIDRRDGIIGIKPSGVDFSALEDQDIIYLDTSGEIKHKGKYDRASVDFPTHLELYNGFPEIGSVIHTHSPYATAHAQALKPIECFGTTHADFFKGSVPVVRTLRTEEVQTNYETNTGKAIVEFFNTNLISPMDVPACLIPGHGVFLWGRSVKETLEVAIALEEIARINFATLALNPRTPPLDPILIEKHFSRKHGSKSYYGQA